MKNKIFPWVELPTRHCIIAFKAIPEEKGFRIYVVWDWDVSVKQGIFSAYKSRTTYPKITEAAVVDACDLGWELSAEDACKIFPELTDRKITTAA